MQTWFPSKVAALLLFVFVLVAEPAHSASRVDAIGITVSDMDTSLDFYTEVLPFRVVSDREIMGTEVEHLFGVFGVRVRMVRLVLGDEHIELIDFIAPEGRPIPVDSRSNDEWFQHIAIIVSDMDKAYAHLLEHDVTHASPAPQRLPDWNPNAGGIEAFYFRDPDGNHLEVLAFPEDKGAKRWHQNKGKLFLGIDHTAIVVRDTDAALQFYRDGLGLTVRGHSENYGIEQERLNNVFGARLWITALAADSGPAIEFLEYLAPRGGRPMPADSAANDLWHWQIHLEVPSPQSAIDRISDYDGQLLSAGVVKMTEDAPFAVGALARGPNGHAVLVYSDNQQESARRD